MVELRELFMQTEVAMVIHAGCFLTCKAFIRLLDEITFDAVVQILTMSNHSKRLKSCIKHEAIA